MPLDFYQYPNALNDKLPVLTNWTPIVGYVLYQSDTTINGFYYYQLAVNIYLGDDLNDELIATLKQRRSGYSADISAGRARAIFDITDIANSVLVDTVVDQNCSGVPFGSIHELGDNTYECETDTGDPLFPCKPLYSVNGDRNTGRTQIAPLAVYGYEFYSTDVNDSPSNQPSTAPTGDSPNSKRYYMKATLPLTDPRSYTDAGVDPYVFQGNNFSEFQCRTDEDRFLSDLNNQQSWSHPDGASLQNQYINYVNDGDYHTVAFLNDYANFTSRLNRMRVKFYATDGTALGSGDVLNSNVAATPYGGCPPDGSESGGTPANVMDNTKRLLYFGCGPANLNAQAIDDDIRPDNKPVNGEWAYYRVQGVANDDSYITAPYYFVRQHTKTKVGLYESNANCIGKGYESVRLAFKNSVGAYDYLNFTMKSKQQTDIKRTTYDTMLGIWNKSVWRYNNTDRGVNVNDVVAKKTYTLNTDFLSESQVVLMESLLLSQRVEIVKNVDVDKGNPNVISDFTVPVIVKDSSFVRKTILDDQIKIQYTIKIELANNQNTNT